MTRIKIFSIGGIMMLLSISLSFAQIIDDPIFSIEDLNFRKITVENVEYDLVSLRGCASNIDQTGAPYLPVKIVRLLLPAQAKVSEVYILDTASTILPDSYYVYPTQLPRYLDGSPPPPFVPPDSAIYNSEEPYPGKFIEVVRTGSMAGYQIVTLKVYPLQYIPKERKLVLYTEVKFALDYTPSNYPSGRPLRLSERSDRVLRRTVKCLVDNPQDLEQFYSQGRIEKFNQMRELGFTELPSIEGNTVDYLIITPDAFVSEFQRLADWKIKKGIPTLIKTVEWVEQNYTGCDLQEKIRHFIQDAYKYWGTIWVLLASDTDFLPSREIGWQCVHPPFFTDFYYADLVHCTMGYNYNWNANGNHVFGEGWAINNIDDIDGVVDIFVGRASVENITEAKTFVDKVFLYEKNPDTTYIDSLLFMAGIINPATDPMTYAEGIIRDFLNKPPYFIDPWELYNPKDGPGTPPQWSGDDILLRATALNAMNKGYHIIYHCDHCSHYSFGTGVEENNEKLYRQDIEALNNSTRPSIIATIGCEPNAFEFSSISETFLNNPNGGCVAFVGNTVEGEIQPHNQLVSLRKFFEFLYDNNIYHLGNLSAMMSQGMMYKFIFSMNLLGDPEMSVWSDTPESLIVAHPDTFCLPDSIFEITVRGLSSADTAVVCVMKGTEAYASMMVNAIDSVATFIYKPYTSGYLNVTVTCHNYFVYEDSCYVAPCANAYLYPHSHFIYDGIVWGNSDGNDDRLANPGETLNVYLSIANSGQDTAFNVLAKLRSEDILISIIDSVVFYDTILDGEVVHKDTLTDGYFTFYLEPNYPDSVLDYHRIDFEIFIGQYFSDNLCFSR